MAVAQVVDVRVNVVGDLFQWVALWGNGRIDSHNCPPVVGGPEWFDRIDQPVAVAIWITDWDTMSGYVLDKLGAAHEFGGAPDLGADGVIVGVPYAPFGASTWYVDWSLDPYNAGRGIALDGFGKLWPFGGAPANPRTANNGNRWSVGTIARKMKAKWYPDGSVHVITMDYSGGLHVDYGAVQPWGGGYWPGADIARDFDIADWTTGAGWLMDLSGGMHPLSGAAYPAGFPYLPGADVARAFRVLNAADPARFLQVWAGGQETEWVASTPPTVVAGGALNPSPAATVTDTTRPLLAIDYSDPQRDSLAEARLLVFTEAFAASRSMADPMLYEAAAIVNVTLTDPRARGVVSPVDLANGGYRLYARARDTAGLINDQWSDWDSHSWTQAVPVPAAPTGLTAAANPDATVSLTVTATTGGVATLVRFDRSDDYDPAAPAAATWKAVDGADAVPIAATVTTVDRFPPQGKTPAWRATAYADMPRVASTPSNVDTADVPIVGHLMHAVDNPTLGGALKVQAMQETRTSSGGAFDTIDGDWPTVVKDGSAPRAIRGTLELLTMDGDAWDLVEQLALSRSTLVLRRPFGDVRYVEILGDWNRQQVRAAALRVENTPLRNMHTTGLPLVEVRPPHLAA